MSIVSFALLAEQVAHSCNICKVRFLLVKSDTETNITFRRCRAALYDRRCGCARLSRNLQQDSFVNLAERSHAWAPIADSTRHHLITIAQVKRRNWIEITAISIGAR